MLLCNPFLNNNNNDEDNDWGLFVDIEIMENTSNQSIVLTKMKYMPTILEDDDEYDDEYEFYQTNQKNIENMEEAIEELRYGKLNNNISNPNLFLKKKSNIWLSIMLYIHDFVTLMKNLYYKQ